MRGANRGRCGSEKTNRQSHSPRSCHHQGCFERAAPHCLGRLPTTPAEAQASTGPLKWLVRCVDLTVVAPKNANAQLRSVKCAGDEASPSILGIRSSTKRSRARAEAGMWRQPLHEQLVFSLGEPPVAASTSGNSLVSSARLINCWSGSSVGRPRHCVFECIASSAAGTSGCQSRRKTRPGG